MRAVFRSPFGLWAPRAPVLPAQGVALGSGRTVARDYRPNGQTVLPAERLARWAGSGRSLRDSEPQGVALGWVNGWAFGPSVVAAVGTKVPPGLQ